MAIPHTTRALMTCLALLTIGCSGGGTGVPSNAAVCTNSLTGLCEPCPGTSVCVDPDSCKLVPCSGSDAMFVSDVGAASDASSTEGDANADASSCVANQRRCGETRPEVCLSGAWMELEPCGSGFKCDKGQCVCANECAAVGQVSCIDDIAAVKTCELKASCLLWSVPKACAPGQECVQGQCQSACSPPCGAGQVCADGLCQPLSVGTLSCGQIVACVQQFAATPEDTVSINACIGKGTEAAQQQYWARKTCIALSCQKLIDAGKVNEAMLCAYSNCGAEQAACLGASDGDCEGLASCLSGCGTSATCVSGCHTTASVSAVKAWYTLAVCGEQYCGGQSGQGYVDCVNSYCVGPYGACFGSSSGSNAGLSCAQILQCAGGCSDKPCAQACKAKGSPQGAAALNALLNCSNVQCGVACGSGTQAQCDQCLQIQCANELAACS